MNQVLAQHPAVCEREEGAIGIQRCTSPRARFTRGATRENQPPKRQNAKTPKRENAKTRKRQNAKTPKREKSARRFGVGRGVWRWTTRLGRSPALSGWRSGTWVTPERQCADAHASTSRRFDARMRKRRSARVFGTRIDEEGKPILLRFWRLGVLAFWRLGIWEPSRADGPPNRRVRCWIAIAPFSSGRFSGARP